MSKYFAKEIKKAVKKLIISGGTKRMRLLLINISNLVFKWKEVILIIFYEGKQKFIITQKQSHI